MTKYVSKFAVAAAAAFALQASVTNSDAAVVDLDAVGPGGDWTLFNWHGETADPPFTSLDSYSFTVPEGTMWVLQVTDYAESGDRFDVLNGGMSLGQTSLGTPGLTTNDPDVAYASPTWSSGQFLLGAGDYNISFTVTEGVDGFNLGGGHLRVIPEPSTGLLLLSGASFFFLRRRR